MSIPRRGFLLGAAALSSSLAQADEAPKTDGRAKTDEHPEVIELWSGVPPNGPGPSGPELVAPNGEYRDVSVPRLRVWRPAKPNGAAVLVVAGGGYRRIAIGKEAEPTARWLNTVGVTAFVLTYRLPNAGWPRAAPFQDAQRAMRLIRSRAPEMALDPARVGIIGFSAGGHLSAMTAVRPAGDLYAPRDAADALSARPSFVGLIYPVLTLMPPFATRVTTESLVGPAPTTEDRMAYSVERLVRADMPPTFLVHADDDRIAPAENSLQMATALRGVGVSVAMHLLRSGGHGFNVAATQKEAHVWPELFATWAGFA